MRRPHSGAVIFTSRPLFQNPRELGVKHCMPHSQPKRQSLLVDSRRPPAFASRAPRHKPLDMANGRFAASCFCWFSLFFQEMLDNPHIALTRMHCLDRATGLLSKPEGGMPLLSWKTRCRASARVRTYTSKTCLGNIATWKRFAPKRLTV